MTIEEINRRVKERIAEIRAYKEQNLPDIVGTEAVNHYRESFHNEGFTDKTKRPWQDVKRRDPASPWYGFDPDNKKHFSQTRASDKILTGDSKELQNSITYAKKPGCVTVYTDKPYAAVHQFGLPAKIFGKKTFKMPARPFIGRSEVLMQKIYDKIKRDLNKILSL